ncbi:YueH family protein [Bacillus cytotoxicus]|uniref:YueH family protein n=1 Tax=Bacillus cytotoxicus TaxID=580165 RepID=A0ACC6A7D3_9BACI|nr:YueH family protein [Bacillus cytotoxicus]
MKKYDVPNGNGSLMVYIEKIDETCASVAIPKKEWSYLLSYDVTYNKFEHEHEEMVRSLFYKAGLPYNQAENLADLIEGWI